MTETMLLTASDVIEHLKRLEGAATDSRFKALSKTAMFTAYRDLPNSKRWSYYYARDRVKTDATQSSSTITFDFTGGASERLITIASGTLPTNFAFGLMLIDTVEYECATRESSTTGTLSVNSNPGADVAAGTSYNWWRDTYPMPVDFMGADHLIDHNNSWQPELVSPGEVLNFRANRQTPNEPRLYGFMQSHKYFGSTAVMFEPPPAEVLNFDFMYKRMPAALRTIDYNTGTVAVSSTTVTGTSTAWTSAMVGSNIRFLEDSTNIPTGLDGIYPYAEQRIVTGFTNATSLTIDAAVDGTYSGHKYRISDPLDIEHGAMLTAYLKCCEYELAQNLSKDPQIIMMKGQRFMQALELAKVADARGFGDRSPGSIRHYNRLRQGTTGNDAG